MKLRFEPNLPHQRDAIDAVVGALAELAADPQSPDAGAAGVISNGDGPRPAPDLAVEMETGTGKTYVMIRSALELAARRGWRKIVVVVPTVAIREGVLKTLAVTREHFSGVLALRYRDFAFTGDVGRLLAWTRSLDIEFAVLTVDAFNKTTNVLRQPSDRCGGQTPLSRVAQCRPLVLLDEPHRFSTPLRREALASLDPLAIVRFGATVGAHPRKVHRLSPREAHARGLVKTITVWPAPVGLDEAATMSAQIEAMIKGHLQRQRTLAARGIKVLSLLFVDRVAGWREDDGAVRAMFRAHYDRLRAGDPRFSELDAEAVTAAYFAQTRGKSRTAVDSKTGRSAADAEAYALIMRDKERLLSLGNPVGFVVSHSALREGWDNPNVFGVCTLARSNSTLRKRQEIGRGVRLCVDQDGRRVVDPGTNVVTVYANESYAEYAASLQREFEDAFDEALRPQLPALASEEGGPSADPSRELVFEFSARTLIDRALAGLPRAQELADAPAAPAEVCARLMRRFPPLPLRDDTVARFLTEAGAVSAAAAASALAGAVQELSGHPGGSA